MVQSSQIRSSTENVKRFLWVLRMPSIKGGKLPRSKPCPVLVDSDAMDSGRYLFNQHCNGLNKEYLIVSLMTHHSLPAIQKTELDRHRVLWLYTSPRRFQFMSWEDYLNSSSTSSRSKSIANSLRPLWQTNSYNVTQAIQWYSTVRGNLERVIERSLPVSLCNDEKWNASQQSDILTDKNQPIFLPRGIYHSVLDKDIPLELRQIIQDTWVTLQQLAHHSLSLSKLKKAEKSLSKVYRNAILNGIDLNTVDKKAPLQPADEAITEEPPCIEDKKIAIEGQFIPASNCQKEPTKEQKSLLSRLKSFRGQVINISV